MQKTTMGTYNDDNVTITKDHSVVNGDNCIVRAKHCVINGDYCKVYGEHHIVNGDYCEVNGKKHIINGDFVILFASDCTINGNGVTDRGTNNKKTKSLNFGNLCAEQNFGGFNFSSGGSTFNIGNLNGIPFSDNGNNSSVYNFFQTPSSTSFTSRPSASSSSSSAAAKIMPVKKSIGQVLKDLSGNDEKAKSDLEQCVICLENKKVVLFRPCKHCACCIACSRTLFSKPSCPTCRASIQDAETIFF